MRNLRYICVQPRLLYYAWQVEVMLNNFLKNGVDYEDIDILVACNPDDDTSSDESIEAWNRLIDHYPDARFFFYPDTRDLPIRYISSIRPNILKQHFQEYPELSKEAIFYHDCDIIFTKPVDFRNFLPDNIWYLSDTNSYINYNYVISKGQDIYDKMCEIVGIDPVIPKLMNSQSGGAQYILKNIDYTFWEKVEKDCEELYFQITQLNNLKKQEDPDYHELQIWCADMWAVLWNGWLKGHETKIIKELDFCWATDVEERFNNVTIFHNAGVTCSCGGRFYKAHYTDMTPYNRNLRIKEGTASYRYYQEIQAVEKTSPLV